jgi:hypothetical protein
MIWTSSQTLALAEQGCAECLGLGLRILERGEPCHCVTRAIFRACYKRFQDCADKHSNLSRASLGRTPGPRYAGTWGRKNEEYAADFTLIAKRALGEESLGYNVFRFHYLLGADWKLCGFKLNLTKGEFFHEAYRVESAVGRACFECEPHPLFPLRQYFSTSRASRPANPPGRKAPPNGAAARRTSTPPRPTLAAAIRLAGAA